jgi:hypothetical protein
VGNHGHHSDVAPQSDVHDPFHTGESTVTRTTLPLTAVALSATAALLLTACGGGSTKGSDTIPGANTAPASSSSPSPSASATEDSVKRPSTALPKDITMTFDWPQTGNAKQDAVLNDGEQYMRAIMRASALNDLKDPAYQFYSRDRGFAYAHRQIKANIDGGWAPTGLDRYYKATANVFKAGSATLSFCRDQSKGFSKSVKTGKVNRTGTNTLSYLLYNLLLVKDADSNGVWQTFQITVIEAAQCKE